MGCMPNWTAAEVDYLENAWGTTSIGTISKQLNRTANAVSLKRQRLGLLSYLESGEYISTNQLYRVLGRDKVGSYTIDHWVKDLHMPVKFKKRLNASVRIIYLKDFWEWAAEYRMHINFAKVEPNILGEEPDWVADQRRADTAFSKYKTTPWTASEEALLKSYLKQYRYTYRDLSIQTKRTMGAIKRRMLELGIRERPLREPPHSQWSESEVTTVTEMYQKGYRADVIQEYINKSAQAIQGKIERLIRDGLLTKWK